MSANLPPRREPSGSETGSKSGDPQKEQYSLDEMMKALRDKEREKEELGEVVTRSDGTIARKVKRRRRRSEQPDKPTPERERRKLMVKLVAAAVAVLILFLTGLFLIIHHNSKGYREKLEAQASEWTGAEVELGGLKRLPFSVSINTANFTWDEDSFLKDLEVKRITGDAGFSAFLGARPGGLRLGGAVGELVVQTPAEKWDGIELKEADEFPFDFDQYYCSALNVRFGKESPLMLKDLSAILSYEGAEGYQVTLDEGFLALAGWDDFIVSNGLMRFKEGHVELKSLSLEHTRKDGLTLGSRLEVTGTVELAPGKTSKLALETERFPLEMLLGQQLGRFLSGTVISSTGEVELTVGENGFDELQMDFLGDSARMEGFPFMANLASLFTDAGFEDFEFDEGISKNALSGTLRVRPSGRALENLRMAKKGKMQLEGDMIVEADGSIRGRFQIALNRFFFTSHSRLRNSPLLAGTEDTGYVRLSFPVGGTLKNPQDGFLRAIGLDSGAISPGSGSQKDDLWNDFQEPSEDIDLIPEELRSLRPEDEEGE